MKRHIWQGIKMGLILAFIVFVIWAVKLDCQNQAYGQFESPATGLSNQSVKGNHVDSTSEDFVFQDGFRGTSVTDDSMFMTKKYIDDNAGGTSDSIGIDVNGGAFDAYIYPAYLREGTNVVFTVTGDTLTIAGQAGAGTADSTYFNDGATQYGPFINDMYKIKEGAGIDIVRDDSTTYDVFNIGATLGTSVDLTSEVTGTLPEANGGTGDTDLDDIIGGTAITVTGGANTIIAGDATVAVTAGGIGTTQIGTDGVSADELNATGVESELEAVLDLQDLQGSVTDGQVPDSMAITLADGSVTYAKMQSNYADSLGNLYQNETIAGNWINTANPWADNEIATSGNWNTAYGWGNHSIQNYLDNDDANVDTATWNVANANFIKSIPIQDTTGNIGDVFGLTFDDSKDTLVWSEFWASPQTTPTDNYVLKVDTDPDPDTLYWAPDIMRKTAEIQTTDATQTTLISHTLLDENTYHTEAYVVAVQSDGTDRASYHIACTVYRTGAGVATLQGSVTSIHTQESNASLDATFTVSGNDIRVSVTGIVAETWEWGTTISYINISN